MGNIKISRYIREKFLDDKLEASPIEEVGTQTFLKFDEIQFDSKTGQVTFRFKNKDVFYFSGEAHNFSPGCLTTINMIEGRMRISLGS